MAQAFHQLFTELLYKQLYFMHVIVDRSAYNNLSWFTSSDLFAVFHLDFSFNLKPTQEYTGER